MQDVLAFIEEISNPRVRIIQAAGCGVPIVDPMLRDLLHTTNATALEYCSGVHKGAIPSKDWEPLAALFRTNDIRPRYITVKNTSGRRVYFSAATYNTHTDGVLLLLQLYHPFDAKAFSAEVVRTQVGNLCHISYNRDIPSRSAVTKSCDHLAEILRQHPGIPVLGDYMEYPQASHVLYRMYESARIAECVRDYAGSGTRVAWVRDPSKDKAGDPAMTQLGIAAWASVTGSAPFISATITEAYQRLLWHS